MTELLVRLGILVTIFASVFILSQLVLKVTWDRRDQTGAVNRRLRMLRSGLARDKVTENLLKNAPLTLGPDADMWMRLRVRMARMVMMSAIPVDARKLLMGCLLAFLALGGLILLLVWWSRFQMTFGVVQLVIAVAAAVSLGLPYLVISRRALSRRRRMEEQFPIALDVFTRSLRAGHPIAAAIDLVTTEIGDPIGSEFGLVSDEIAYGADLTDALLAMAERWDLEDMRMFVVSVSVQSETGGNLAEILESLSSVIRSRASMYMKVRALSSEGRMTGWMLTVLPVLTFLTVFLLSPKFYLDVAQDFIFVVGFPMLMVLYLIGILWIRKIIDLKV